MLRKIVYIFRRILYIMSKFAQTFSRKRQKWKLDVRVDRLVRDGEEDVQEVVNSSYDDLLYAKLEDFYDAMAVNVSIDYSSIDEDLDNAFGDVNGSKADKVLKAFEVVSDIRKKYNLADDVSDKAVIDFIKNKSVPVSDPKGGVTVETQTQNNQESE